jgi:hypothetical protein
VPPAELPRIRALLELGADPNRRFREYTPLMMAVAAPQTPPAMWFMGHPPSKPRLVGGYTPLKIVKQRGRDEIASIVLQAGARK